MSNTSAGFGDAASPEIVVDTSPDPVDEARLAEGRVAAHAVFLAEAKDAVVRAHEKLERTQAELSAAEQIVVDAEAAVAALEGEG